MGTLRYLLLMRHAKHRRKPEDSSTPGASGKLSPLAEIAKSLRTFSENQNSQPASLGVTEPYHGLRVLTAQGRDDTKSVCERLKEHIDEWKSEFRVAGIIHAGESDPDTFGEARQTAEIAKGLLSIEKMEGVPLLETKVAISSELWGKGPAKLTESVDDEVRKAAQKLVGDGSAGTGVLIVGHQPILGWLSEQIVGAAHPLAHSEILCLDLKPKIANKLYHDFHEEPLPLLSWVISPGDNATLEDLRDKIKSKMTIANLLTAFIAAGLGFILPTLLDSPKLNALGPQKYVALFAALLLFLAVLLFLRTMISYDTLLMPTRFWSDSGLGTASRPPWIVARPPSSAHWILYQNMVRIWRWQFLPATYCVLSGLFLLVAALFVARWNWWGDSRPLKILSCLVSLFVPLLVIAVTLAIKARLILHKTWAAWSGYVKCPIRNRFRYLCGPWLGSED